MERVYGEVRQRFLEMKPWTVIEDSHKISSVQLKM